ncbi:MAG TPA: metal ABC transporter substrate-binding protein [Geobacteraceae bacterium]|nr:metal ABC transporter substrate-binding protein [Geobacteraceae bacterium]
MKKSCLWVVMLIGLALICACQKKEAPAPSAQKKLTVVTTLFPLYDFARAVGGERADVTLLMPPGVEPHSFEPKPEDIVKVNRADLFVFTNAYMEPWAKSFVNSLPAGNATTVVDSSKGVNFIKAGPEEEDEGEHGGEHHHHGGMDPHIWLDFANAQIMVDNIAAAMIARDPAGREYYTTRAAAYREELSKLDDAYRAGLAGCRKHLLLHGGHYAFGYLAKRYGLTYVSAAAVNADAEPTPARLAELVRLMRENGLKYVFSEELLAPRSAETIAKETGAQVLILHGAHNISRDDFAKGVTFVSLMKKNLENLRTGLECR